ncbi:MAG: alanine--tRNA ligase [Actinomycetia bacterium]|nr:alanine--tRNA ligase [Actinomycetes bacterium]
MTGKEIRDIFIRFFEQREHRVVSSSSLVPNDPTLLLTSAGMVQFKSYFQGEEKPPYRRATSVQKCLRTTDIESVGITARHNTFFEMLGNFSFGDYYKESAIPWAWELVTVVLGIDPATLWISVYTDDDEAERIWKDTPGVVPERVFQLGEEDNFWKMGATGPCGPCSEILYDRGEEFACGPDCRAGCDCDRFLELWNLVFIQYDRQADGSLVPLPEQSIDTGMGLERVAVIKQGVATIFETDLIMPVVASIAGLSGVGLGDSPATDVSIKVVADHARAATFLISDGVVPSNEGRGYILRRLLRRAVRHGRLLGIGGFFINGLADVVVELLGDVYPGLKEHHSLVSGVIAAEEERFGQTLQQGVDLLGGVIDDLGRSGGDTIIGKTVFYLHDTLGFPLELTEEIALDQGVSVDREGFNALMEEQRERARQSRETEVDDDRNVLAELCRDKGRTFFDGYRCATATATVVALVSGGRRVEAASGDEQLDIILDRTPFYAESGGQVGDTGTIEGPGGTVEVEDTVYGAPGLVVQRGVLSGSLAVGDEVEAVVDTERRMAISRNHSATHILHWALREVLGTHARQSGSYVTPERLRFDFIHFKPVSPGELGEIERLANDKVLADVPVVTVETARQEAMDSGAVALFGEKYADDVRVVEMGEFSRELCGGIHVDRTGRVGPISIVSESGIGAGLRRIEATSGQETLRHYRFLESLVGEAGGLLKVNSHEIPERVAEILSQLRELERGKAKEESRDVAGRAREIARGARVSGAVMLARVDGEGQKALRDLADIIMNENDCGVLAIAGAAAGKAQIVVKVERQLADKGLDARELAIRAGVLIGGGGGGRPDMAVAGGGRVEGIDEALDAVGSAVAAALEGEG